MMGRGEDEYEREVAGYEGDDAWRQIRIDSMSECGWDNMAIVLAINLIEDTKQCDSMIRSPRI